MRVWSVSRRALMIGGVITVAGGQSLGAQVRSMIPDAHCPAPLPQPFSLINAPSVTIRLSADGDYPDPDVAAARAINVLIRDILTERAPVTLLSSIDVQRRVLPLSAPFNDVAELSARSKLLSGVVRRVGDSVIVMWNIRTAGYEVTSAADSHRSAARIDDISRIALMMAETAAQASVASAQSLGTAPPALGSVDAGEAYVMGLSEILSTRPDALRRARAGFIKATTIVAGAADVWRWRARAENSLVEWNRASGANSLKGLQVTLVGSALRAVQLAPRSAGAHVTLADAYLASGDREKAEQAVAAATALDADGPGVGRVSAELSRIRGNDARALAELRTAVQMSPRDGSLLVALANLARLRGDGGLACHALNAAIASDEDLAPAFALRALVRAELGERRSAWIDAEVATRLGHPEWGERAAAVLDAKYGDRFHADIRLDAVGGLLARPANYLDAILLAQAAVATSRRGAVPNLAAAWPCTELRRNTLIRDLRSLGVIIIDTCYSSTTLGGTIVPKPTVPRSRSRGH